MKSSTTQHRVIIRYVLERDLGDGWHAVGSYVTQSQALAAIEYPWRSGPEAILYRIRQRYIHETRVPGGQWRAVAGFDTSMAAQDSFDRAIGVPETQDLGTADIDSALADTAYAQAEIARLTAELGLGGDVAVVAVV